MLRRAKKKGQPFSSPSSLPRRVEKSAAPSWIKREIYRLLMPLIRQQKEPRLKTLRALTKRTISDSLIKSQDLDLVGRQAGLGWRVQ